MQEKFKSVLFDLDGTLLDTAPDLTYALNELRATIGLPALAVGDVREAAAAGAAFMLHKFVDDSNDLVKNAAYRNQYLSLYRNCLDRQTDYFAGMQDVLAMLDKNKMPWGIVTNKPTWLTEPLLDALSISARAGCIVCGDTLAASKPDPAPLFYACKKMNVDPAGCVYVGDSLVDIQAGHNAGMQTVLAAYGYVPRNVDHTKWKAHFTITHPLELLEIL